MLSKDYEIKKKIILSANIEDTSKNSKFNDNYVKYNMGYWNDLFCIKTFEVLT